MAFHVCSFHFKEVFKNRASYYHYILLIITRVSSVTTVNFASQQGSFSTMSANQHPTSLTATCGDLEHAACSFSSWYKQFRHVTFARYICSCIQPQHGSFYFYYMYLFLSSSSLLLLPCSRIIPLPQGFLQYLLDDGPLILPSAKYALIILIIVINKS